MDKYRKTILAAITAAGTIAITFIGDTAVSTEDILTWVTALSGVVLVWGIPNEPAA